MSVWAFALRDRSRRKRPAADKRRYKESSYMKKIAAALILVTVCCAVVAEEFEGVIYRLEGPRGPRQRAIITGYEGGSKAIEVKDRIQGVIVNRIAAGAYANQGLGSADIPGGLDNENGLTVENGAFTGNSIRILTIGNNVNLEPRAFDNNFAAYYITQGKRRGTFMWNGILSKWQTQNEYAAWEQTTLIPAQPVVVQPKPVPSPPPPQPSPPPSPPPSYTPDIDIDMDFMFLFGGLLNLGYLEFYSAGINLQTGLILDTGDVQLALLGQAEGALMLLALPSWGIGVMGELYFDYEFGIGVGTGLANSLWYALDMGSGGTETENDFAAKQYVRGAFIMLDDAVLEADKMTFYADYFLNGNWRIGFSFHYGYGLSDYY
jgi:hypothetical protein